jgi:hypothetical protein
MDGGDVVCLYVVGTSLALRVGNFGVGGYG